MIDELQTWLDAHTAIAQLVYLSTLLFVSFAVYWLTRGALVVIVRRWAAASETRWDDALVGAGVFGRLAHLPPALVVYYGVQLVPDLHGSLALLIQRVAFSFLIAVATLATTAFLSAANDIYASKPENRTRPIKGYLQVLGIVLHLVAALLIVATLMDRSPLLFLSGIGAMTAVLLLVFRDTILSLVASVQLTTNDMIHVGDWIEMPKFGADGDVIDVALHTVTVQNFDKTITTIPTHALIAESFRNWRGMAQAGGRRIKRSIFIDLSTVRFLDDAELDDLGGLELLSDYIDAKRREIAAHNERAASTSEREPNVRRLTNIGTFRAYAERYLRAHPGVHHGMTLLVRQLQPTDRGLPIELYCFANTTAWAAYESIQADIFDHVLAIVPRFGLRTFQSPTGADVAGLAERARAT